MKLAPDDLDVEQCFALDQRVESGNRLIGDGDRVDAALGSDGPGEPRDPVAAAGTNLSDSIARAQLESLDYALGALPPVPTGRGDP